MKAKIIFLGLIVVGLVAILTISVERKTVSSNQLNDKSTAIISNSPQTIIESPTIPIDLARQVISTSDLNTDETQMPTLNEVLAKLRELDQAWEGRDWKAFQTHLTFFFDELQRIMVLSEHLESGQALEEDRPRIVKLFSTTAQVYKAALREPKFQQTGQKQFLAVLKDIVRQTPRYPAPWGEKVLSAFAATGLFDESWLEILLALPRENDLKSTIIGLIVDAALASQPRRMDLVNQFLFNEKTEFDLDVVSRLLKFGSKEIEPLLLQIYADSAGKPEAQTQLREMYARYAPPAIAFTILTSAIRDGNKSGLTSNFYLLAERGAGEFAVDLYFTEKDPNVRRYLVIAGAKEMRLLEAAADADSDPDVRGYALIHLAMQKADTSTGQLLLQRLIACRGYASEATYKKKGDLNLGVILLALQNYSQNVSGSSKSSAVTKELLNQAIAIANDPSTPNEARSTAQIVIEKLNN